MRISLAGFKSCLQHDSLVNWGRFHNFLSLWSHHLQMGSILITFTRLVGRLNEIIHVKFLKVTQ